MERLEGTFFSTPETGDLELFYQTWQGPDPKGSIILTHGLGEHSECYHQFATDMVQDQWTVHAWDLRGHGRSEGKRGYARDFNDLISDLGSFVEFFKANLNRDRKPLVLLGHSLGGLILLKYLIDMPPREVAAVVCSSPALGVSLEIPSFKKKGAQFLADWMPKITLHNEIDYGDLHRDPERLKEYRNDPLRHDKISPGFYLGLIKAMDEVNLEAVQVQYPILFQLAGREKVVSSSHSEAVFDKLGSKTKKLIVYPDSLHEIYNDLGRALAISDLKNFLREYTR